MCERERWRKKEKEKGYERDLKKWSSNEIKRLFERGGVESW